MDPNKRKITAQNPTSTPATTRPAPREDIDMLSNETISTSRSSTLKIESTGQPTQTTAQSSNPTFARMPVAPEVRLTQETLDNIHNGVRDTLAKQEDYLKFTMAEIEERQSIFFTQVTKETIKDAARDVVKQVIDDTRQRAIRKFEEPIQQMVRRVEVSLSRLDSNSLRYPVYRPSVVRTDDLIKDLPDKLRYIHKALKDIKRDINYLKTTCTRLEDTVAQIPGHVGEGLVAQGVVTVHGSRNSAQQNLDIVKPPQLKQLQEDSAVWYI